MIQFTRSNILTKFYNRIEVKMKGFVSLGVRTLAAMQLFAAKIGAEHQKINQIKKEEIKL
jgi:hypothetical protein